MLNDAIASWISGLSERQFDEPVIWLLRGHGFYDIHFTHGTFEFGKDFIAKRNEPTPVQYAVQSKAGDIGGGEWSQMLGQLNEMVAPLLAHPNFDRALHRRHVLLTTGILKGKAILSATAYRDQVASRGDGEFVIWDRETLAEMLLGSSVFPLRLSSEVSALLGSLQAGTLDDRMIERLCSDHGGSIRTKAEHWRALADCHFLAAELIRAKREFNAITATLAGVRVGALAILRDIDGADAIATCALVAYERVAGRVLGPFLDEVEAPKRWLERLGAGPSVVATYPIACARSLEYVGIAGLRARASGDLTTVAAMTRLAARLIQQPGASRIISDRWATSLAPAALLLAIASHDGLGPWLRGVAKFLCDRLDQDGVGLAGPDASPKEEVEHLLGSSLTFVETKRRDQSVLAGVLADLTHAVAPELYPIVVNDLLAVDCVPCFFHAHDTVEACLTGGVNIGITSIVRPRYPESAGDPLPHQQLQVGRRRLESLEGGVLPLVLACLLRDRPFTDVYRRILVAPPT